MATEAEVELALLHLKVGTSTAVIVESGSFYVQVADSGPANLVMEAVSDEFLESRLTPDQHRRLVDFGFRLPAKNGSPNHWMIIEKDRIAIAELMLEVLTSVYGVDAAAAEVLEVS